MATKSPKKTVKKTDTVKKKPGVKSAKKSSVKATTVKSSKKTVSKKTTSKKVESKSTKKVDKKKDSVEKTKQEKHPSELIKKTKEDSHKTLAIVTAIIMIILVILFFTISNNSNNDKDSKKGYDKKDTFFTSYDSNTVLIIEDSTCQLCQVGEFALGVQAEIDPQATIITLEYNDPEAQKFIEEFNLNQVPIVLFSTSFENTEVWTQLSAAFNKISYNGDEYYQLTYNTPQIKKVLEEPVINEKTISFGNTNSNQVIYEFCSYETALCGLVNGNTQYLGEVREATPDYKSLTPSLLAEDTTNIIVIHVPQEDNLDAYIAAYCANEQGKYSEFRNSLYDNQFEWVPLQDRNTIFANYALQSGINVQTFTSCLENNREMYIEQLTFEVNIAQEFNLAQFPAFIANKYVISGPLDFDSYQNILTQ
jgi:hypothetical protein